MTSGTTTTAMTIHGITRAAYLAIVEWPGLSPRKLVGEGGRLDELRSARFGTEPITSRNACGRAAGYGEGVRFADALGHGVLHAILGSAFLLVAGCGGAATRDAVATQAAGDSLELSEGRVSFEIGGVPPDQTKVWAAEKQGGPPRGWWVGDSHEFFVETPAQSVEHPAKLTFTIRPDPYDDFTQGRVDQLGVFLPGGLVMVPQKSSMCPPSGRAEPDPCIASAEFLENGDGQLVVLASDPSTG